MNVITADIIDYLGKYENGVLVLLNLNFNGEFSEATIYYSMDTLALTVSEEVEKKLGTQIELWSGYRELVISILKRVVPYDEIINRLDDVNFSEHFSQNNQSTSGEEIDESDIDISK